MTLIVLPIRSTLDMTVNFDSGDYLFNKACVTTMAGQLTEQDRWTVGYFLFSCLLNCYFHRHLPLHIDKYYNNNLIRDITDTKCSILAGQRLRCFSVMRLVGGCVCMSISEEFHGNIRYSSNVAIIMYRVRKKQYRDLHYYL